MLNFKRKDAVTVAIALAIGLYAYFILFPSIRVATRLYSQASRLSRDVRAAQRDRSDINRLELQEEQLKKKLDQYEEKFLDPSQVDSILSDISKEALGVEAKIAWIEPVKPDDKSKPAIPAKPDAFLSYPVRLGLKASYHKIGLFINRLETGERFVRINDISIQSDASDEYNHNASILMEAYVMKK